MNLKEKEIDGVVLLELSGKLMGGPDATLLSEKLHDLVDQKKTKVVADLGKVSWMNSSGLGILIGGLTTMRNSDGDLKLINVTGKIESLLIITKLIKIFDSYENVDDAVKSFK
ncbi:STAS domain-containing protein [candidate division KSB1 bacterium]|nr:STAS domain-containing protein [candidate division KSB1 bacterium]